MPPQKPRWMLWLQKSWQNKALWKNTQDPLPTARQGIFLLNHVEEFDILKSRSLWMERNIMFVKIKADIRHWLRELDKKYFCVMLGFAVMVYFPLISLKLTNTVDGLWTTAEYMAGAWELSNGRWFWLVTSFLRFSLQLEPINAVVCLVLVSLGVTRLHMLFKPAWMRTSCIDWLAGLCYVSNVVVGCYLSFHFIAPEYGFSFFFAMLATEHVIRGKSAVSSIVPAAVLLALSLGLYQTNLACFCLVLPMMCTVFMVATSQASFYIPMSGGLALFLPVCFWLLDSSREGKTACDAFRKCWNKAEKALILLTAAAVVYGSVFMSAVDQQAMYEGRKATKQIADLVAGELVAEGYYDLPEKLPVMLVGRPSASPLFRTHIIYWDANDYAQVGLFEKENAATMRYSWNAVFRDLTPMQLELCSDEVYDELIRTEEIKRMPTFPEKGSMQEMDGVYVIKISEDYLIDE